MRHEAARPAHVVVLVAAPVPQAQCAPLVAAGQQLEAGVREDGDAGELLVGQEKRGPGECS